MAENSNNRKTHRLPLAILCVCGNWLWKSSKERTPAGVLSDEGVVVCRNISCSKYGLKMRVPSVEVEEVGKHEFQTVSG